MTAAVDNVFNFVQLTPRIGTSGQPTAEQFADIAAAGYRAVINLAMPDSDNALADEGSLVSAQGMSYVHLPVDFAAPTPEHVRRFAGVMESFKDVPVFVHCAMNLRVSAFMYLYLRYCEGASDSEARSPILAKWDPRMDDVWRAFLTLEREEIWDAD